MGELDSWFKIFTKGAKEFGALEASAIWALFCMVLGAIIVYDKREASRKFDVDRTVRENKAVVESKTADALFKLGDAYERLSDRFEMAIDLLKGGK